MNIRHHKPFYILATLIALFIVPLISAWWLVDHRQAIGTGQTNHGELITPPLQLSRLKLTHRQQFQGKWLLLYVNPANQCNTLCQTNIDNMERIRRATGKEIARTRSILLSFNSPQHNTKTLAALQKQYPQLITVLTSKQQMQQFLAHSPGAHDTFTVGSLYLVDPHGNVFMHYSAKANPNGIYKDLKKLLKISQIG